MSDALRLFIVAGEASGDRIGADLVERLRDEVDVELVGVGGEELEALGLRSLFPMENLSVMGWSDVMLRLPLLLWRLRQTVRAIRRSRPDIVVLIDSQVFSKSVAERVRRSRYRVPMVLYVAPSVWGYHPERAAALRPLFDEVLAVLPFEPGVMKELGGPPTTYVGHPATRRFAMRPEMPDRGPFLLLPGSRRGEIARHMPLMKVAAERMGGSLLVSDFVIPTLPHLVGDIERATRDWRIPVRIVTGTDRRREFEAAVAAFAVSGTVTLELAMAGVPMAVTYVADKKQAVLLDKHKLPPLALPNIIAGKRVVEELVFTDTVDTSLVEPALRRIVDDRDVIAAQLDAFADIRALLERGVRSAPIMSPAERVLNLAWPEDPDDL